MIGEKQSWNMVVLGMPFGFIIIPSSPILILWESFKCIALGRPPIDRNFNCLRHLGQFWSHPWPSWSHFGASWGHLCVSWGLLRSILAHIGAIFGHLRTILGYSGAILTYLGNTTKKRISLRVFSKTSKTHMNYAMFTWFELCMHCNIFDMFRFSVTYVIV